MTNRRRQAVLADQHRRQRWEGVVILAAAIGAVIFAFLQAPLPQVSDSHDLASNVLFVLLINLNIILLVLLVFFVGRNLIKLFYERRHIVARFAFAFSLGGFFCRCLAVSGDFVVSHWRRLYDKVDRGLVCCAGGRLVRRLAGRSQRLLRALGGCSVARE